MLWQHLFHTSTPIITRWYFISFFKYSVKCSLNFKSTIQTNVCNRITRIFQTLACIVQPYIVTHKLRFTSASLAKNQGQCEQDIQHNLGHSNIQQTQHYDSHATTEYNYGMAADIYDKKYNVTKCNQTFEHKKSPQTLINSRLEATHSNAADRNRTVLSNQKYW